jgi:CheY-like chemotaxis protein
MEISRWPSSRILVIDDDEIIRRLLTITLEKQGYEVHAAATGADALERLEALAPHLVLVDATMPDMDGYEVCRRIGAGGVARPHLVMMSAGAGPAERDRAREAGADEFVAKPIDRPALVARLHQILGAAG